ncbi:MAG: hypothetical protein OXG34_05145 [bacterium]|nr:hypothetical protein [bacterium]
MIPIVASSAGKHGIREDSMIHAIRNPVRIESFDDGFTMFIGPDHAGNFLEVGVIDSDRGPVVVHAMSARPKYLR